MQTIGVPINIFTTEYELIFALLNEIGLSLTSENYIIDRDNGQLIRYNDRSIKTSIDPLYPVYPTEYYILLDINDARLMNTLFGYYLEKESSMNGLEPLTYWNEEPDGKLGVSALSIKLSDNTIHTTRYYNNKALKFIEMILKLGGYEVDLTNFDIEWMKANAISTKRGTR